MTANNDDTLKGIESLLNKINSIGVESFIDRMNDLISGIDRSSNIFSILGDNVQTMVGKMNEGNTYLTDYSRKLGQIRDLANGRIKKEEEYNGILKEILNLNENWEKNILDSTRLEKSNKETKERIAALEKEILSKYEKQKQEITDKNSVQFKENEYQLAILKYKKAQIESEEKLANIKQEILRNATKDKLSNTRSRIRKENLRDKTRDNEGRTKSNKEIEELKNKFKESKEENTEGRKGGIITSKIAGGLAKGANFINSDQQVSISGIGNKIADVAGNFGPWGKAAGAMIQIAATIMEMYDKVNKASSDYARSVGGGIAKMNQMKGTATGIASAISKWGGKAYKFDKILEHTAALSEKTGRVMDKMSQADFKSLEDLTQWGISPEIMNQYDTFGLSIETIDKKIHDVYSISGRHGLNAKAVTDQLNRNLKLAQNYTFAGGLKALTRMAEKATSLKIDMSAAATFAEKVSTLEGATSTAAELSVLGGRFAQIANPLQLLYGGLQDPEVLFDKMLNTTKGKVHWDQEKGMFDMNAFERMQLKQASQSMGVDFNTLWTAAQKQGQHERIDSQLGGRVKDKDTREYIRNLTQWDENGKGYITFHNGDEERKVDISGLTDTDYEILKKESELMADKDNAKIGDVLLQTRTMTEKINDIVDTLKTKIFAFMVDKWGTDEKKAKFKGVNDKNAEFFEDLSDAYHNNSKDSIRFTKLKERLNELGIDESSKEYKSFINHKLSQNEFDDLLIGLILKKQGEGYTYRGNGLGKKQVVNALNSKFDRQWEMNDNEGYASGGFTGGEENKKAGIVHGQEFVINANATRQLGLPLLNAMNNGDAQKYFKQMSVAPIQQPTMQTPQSMQISMQPLQINIGGQIDLVANGKNLGSINGDQLLTRETIAAISRELSKYMSAGVLNKMEQPNPFSGISL